MKKNILEYLEKSAQKYPDKTAFADENTSCTFKELECTGRKIGTALSRYIAPRNPIPIFMEKSVETIGAFMGAVYAGCFYVLIDTKQPASRLNQILDILKSEVIVTSEKYLKDLEKLGFEGKVLMLSELNAVQEDPIILETIRNQAVDIDPLYGIFTWVLPERPKVLLWDIVQFLTLSTVLQSCLILQKRMLSEIRHRGILTYL